MRTVHEIETGKPPEPPVKAPVVVDHKSKRRRSPSYTENGQDDDENDPRYQVDSSEMSIYSDVDRYRYLKRKFRWATERNENLRKELQEAEAHRWQNWTEKEMLLDRVLAKEEINIGFPNREGAA
jgi:hypothetical protein